MVWQIEYTDEFEEWWDTLSDEEQTSVRASVELLDIQGPALGFPHDFVPGDDRPDLVRAVHVPVSCFISLRLPAP